MSVGSDFFGYTWLLALGTYTRDTVLRSLFLNFENLNHMECPVLYLFLEMHDCWRWILLMRNENCFIRLVVPIMIQFVIRSSTRVSDLLYFTVQSVS